MSKIVRFNGRAYAGEHDSLSTRQPAGVWFTGEKPAHLEPHIATQTERLFDRALADEYGRACGDDCCGDCFAEFFAAAHNVGHEKQSPAPFTVHDLPKPSKSHKAAAPAAGE